MNEALEFYNDEKKIWHISGWNYPINTDGLDDVFLWRVMNCWGWATWADRWKYYEKDVDKIINEFTNDDIKRFNLDGVEDFWGQVVANKEEKINTWAIFWYIIIFKKNGLCLNPTQTFVENIGLDGSGVHCGKIESYKSNLSKLNSMRLIHELEENEIILDRIKTFYISQKKNLFIRVINKLSRVTLGKNIIE